MNMRLISTLMVCIWMCGGVDGHEVKLVQEVMQTDEVRLDWVWQMKVAGPNLFVSVHRDSDIHWYRRDLSKGTLAHVATIDLDKDLGRKKHSNPYTVLSPKNILYVSGDWTHAHSNKDSLGLSWYGLDPKTKTTKRLGHIPLDAGAIFPARHPNLLYLAAHFSKNIQSLRLDPETGAPKVIGSVAGAGMGSRFCVSQDGGHFYSMDHSAIGWGTIGADGSLTYQDAVKLDVMKPLGRLRSSSLGLSPDGKHAYVSLAGYGVKNAKGKYSGYNATGLFLRDESTGQLTFSKLLTVDRNMHKITRFVFRKGGLIGYYSSGNESSGNCLGWFKRDPDTGDLSFGGVAPKSKGKGPGHFDYAPDSGTLYMAGTWSTKSFMIYDVP